MVLALIATAVPGPADIFHLKGGGSIDGQLVSDEGGQYRIRTTLGNVTVPVDSVERIDRAVSAVEEYEQRVAAAEDTPAGQTELAAWCAERSLSAERRKHLQRALELDPDYAPARRELGFVRVNGLWVDARKNERPATNAPESRPDKDKGGSGAEAAPDREQLGRVIQAQWYQRIRAIRRNLLDSSMDRLFEEGRTKIRDIRDPLAILPLAQVLSSGGVHCRTLLVETLARFSEDEATMNLALIALLDRDRDVRHTAHVELARRKDTRVVAQYRTALRSGNELVIRRAAEALGAMKAAEAVPDLVDVLTARQNKWVEVPVDRAVSRWPDVFSQRTIVYLGNSRIVHHPEIGLYGGNYMALADDVKNEWQYRNVTVYRTEVLEALKAITSENFGFERERWQKWREEAQS